MIIQYLNCYSLNQMIYGSLFFFFLDEREGDYHGRGAGVRDPADDVR